MSISLDQNTIQQRLFVNVQLVTCCFFYKHALCNQHKYNYFICSVFNKDVCHLHYH
jgi:hypothetical protein